MGGYGALLAAQLHPRLFTAVAALSAAVWPNHPAQASAVPDAFDGGADYRRYDPFTHAGRLAHTPVFIACGTGDPFHAADVELAATPAAATTGTSGRTPPAQRSPSSVARSPARRTSE